MTRTPELRSQGTSLLGNIFGGVLLAVAAVHAVVFGASAVALVVALTAVLILVGDRYVLRPALSRKGEAVVCRYAPWNELGISLAFGLTVLVTALGLTSKPRFGPGFIFGVILVVLLIVVAAKFLRGHQRCLVKITPTSLSVSLPDQSYAVAAIPRERVQSIAPVIQRIIAAHGSRDVLLTQITYLTGDCDPHATRTVRLGPAPAADTVWLSLKPSNLLTAMQAWKDADPGDAAVLDRVEAILRGRGGGRPRERSGGDHKPVGLSAGPQFEGGDVTADGVVAGPVRPRATLPWWGRGLVVAIGLVFLIGWRREDASVARIAPVADTWFSSGQTVTVELTAGQPRTVYWDFQNIQRSVRATAECRAVERQSGSEIALEKVAGDLRVGNWKSLVTVRPSRSGSVELSCYSTGAKTARFGVGQEVPAPRLLNGVANYSGSGLALLLVGLVFVVPVLIAPWFLPQKPAARTWVFRFWAPLLIAVVLTVSQSSLWDGFLFGLLWYGIGWFYWRNKSRSAAAEH